jgi:hypothetical protein
MVYPEAFQETSLSPQDSLSKSQTGSQRGHLWRGPSEVRGWSCLSLLSNPTWDSFQQKNEPPHRLYALGLRLSCQWDLWENSLLGCAMGASAFYCVFPHRIAYGLAPQHLLNYISYKQSEGLRTFASRGCCVSSIVTCLDPPLMLLSMKVTGAGQCVPMYLLTHTPHGVMAPTCNLKLKWAKSSFTTS